MSDDNAKTPPPVTTAYEFTFKVTLDLGVAAPERLPMAVTGVLAEWSDGRKPYPVELLEDGLGQVIRMAVCEAVGREMRLKFPEKRTLSDAATESWTRGLHTKILEHIKCVAMKGVQR